MDIDIRYARPDELERVNELRNMIREIHASARNDMFHRDMNDEFMKHVVSEYNSDDFDILVALIDDEVCGFAEVECFNKPASLYRMARQIYRIVDIGVDERYRRIGVATALLDTIRKDAIDKGFDRVELEMWEFNDSIKFFEEEGFTTFRRFMEMKLID